MAEETANPEHPGVTSTKADKELIGQTSYSDVVVEPDVDTGFDPHYHGIEVLSGGDVKVQTGAGQEVTLALTAGRIYPIEIQKIVSSGTTVSRSDIWLYAA